MEYGLVRKFNTTDMARDRIGNNGTIDMDKIRTGGVGGVVVVGGPELGQVDDTRRWSRGGPGSALMVWTLVVVFQETVNL